jgi:Cof subfamily protein (haloacid dehalogenase superfamily)
MGILEWEWDRRDEWKTRLGFSRAGWQPALQVEGDAVWIFGDLGVVGYTRRMSVRLIALDIDGTLLNSRWEVSLGNRAAIAEATRRGIEVCLVTGRRYDFAMLATQQVESPLTMIVNNGAMVRTNEGATKLRHLLPRETARRVLQATETWRDAASVVFDRPKANQVVLEAIHWDDSLRSAYYARNREFLGVASPLESCLVEDPIQVMFAGSMELMREAEAVLRSEAFAGEIALAVTQYEAKDFSMIDVIHPNVTKGATLAEWAALRDISAEEILAIGDNLNDVEMLCFAGIPVVMENSVPELKMRGWHITRSNDEDGVAAAIQQFALSEATECA